MPYQVFKPHDDTLFNDSEEDDETIESQMYKLCSLKIYVNKDDATRHEDLRDAGPPPNIEY